MKGCLSVICTWIAIGAFAKPASIQMLPTVAGTELESGLYYLDASSDIMVSGTNSPALKVKPGATVALYIPSGKFLTVKGGDGSGVMPGGAGIEVPTNATLVVTGGGTLVATGGNAGNGGDGQPGESGEDRSEKHDDGTSECDALYAGGGGRGGAGGGGAGAGIGGRGGVGGEGGEGAAARVLGRVEMGGECGEDGEDGGNGESAGNLYFLGQITVLAFGGSFGDPGQGGEGGDAVGPIDASGSANEYAAYGGGGGGGGNSGMNLGVFGGIGGGGGSGGGGGGGGSGGVKFREDGEKLYNDDYWGHGGLGDHQGKTKAGTYPWLAWGGASAPGFGGVAGRHGETGDGGVAYRSASASVKGRSVFARTDVTSHAAIGYKVIFENPDDCLCNCPPEADVFLGMPYPTTVNGCTTSDPGMILEGWYTERTGGVKVYGTDGKPLPSVYEHYEGDQVLYPHLKDAATVPTDVYIDGKRIGGPDEDDRKGEGWRFEKGTVTLTGKANRGAYDFRGTNRNGQIKFLLPSGSNTVLLSGLFLRNDRPGIGGLIDVAPGACAKIALLSSGNVLQTSGDAAAIHCPTGASVTIVGVTNNLCARQVVPWTATQNASYCIVSTRSPDVWSQLILKAGEGAAEIGGVKGELCGEIKVDDCEILVPYEKMQALSDVLHVIGHGELPATTPGGGHVTLGTNVPLVVQTDDASWAMNVAKEYYVGQLAFPRPHDVNGVPLTPVDHACEQAGGMWYRYFFFVQPGCPRIFLATETTNDVDAVSYSVLRSGDPIRK